MHRQYRNRCRLCTALALACAAFPLGAADAVDFEVIASEQPGWPRFGGPFRDSVSRETGLLRSWPEGGPRIVWTAEGIDKGYSSPVISNGMLYITGDAGDELAIHAFTVDGARKWRTTNGKSWKGSYPGARASCVIDGDAVYHVNTHGRVACLDAATGAERWAVDVLERFDAKNITWGITDNMIVDSTHVLVTPAGEKALAVALDKKTGEVRWASPALPGETATYAAPLLVRRGDSRQYIGCASASVFGVDADTGALLWTVPQPVEKSVIMMAPVLYGDSVFVGNATPEKAEFFRVRIGAKDVPAEKVWSNSCWAVHGGLVRAGDRLFGAYIPAGGKARGLYSIDIPSGALTAIPAVPGMGASLFADGRLYYLTEEGIAALIKPTETGGELAGRFDLPQPPQTQDIWAHPVICDKRLYLRCHDKLYCYDVGA